MSTHAEQPHVPPSELVPLFRRLPQPGELWRASDGLMGDVHIDACPVAPLLLQSEDARTRSIADRLVQFTQGGAAYVLPIRDFMALIPWTTVGASGQGPRTYYAPRFYCVSGPHDERRPNDVEAASRLTCILDLLRLPRPLQDLTVAEAEQLLMTIGRVARGEV